MPIYTNKEKERYMKAVRDFRAEHGFMPMVHKAAEEAGITETQAHDIERDLRRGTSAEYPGEISDMCPVCGRIDCVLWHDKKI